MAHAQRFSADDRLRGRRVVGQASYKDPQGLTDDQLSGRLLAALPDYGLVPADLGASWVILYFDPKDPPEPSALHVGLVRDPRQLLVLVDDQDEPYTLQLHLDQEGLRDLRLRLRDRTGSLARPAVKRLPLTDMAAEFLIIGQDLLAQTKNYLDQPMRGLEEHDDGSITLGSPPPVTEPSAKTHRAADALLSLAEAVADAVARKREHERAGQPRAETQEIVDAYREAVAAGVRAPRQVVARRFHYSVSHVGRLLVEARRAGLLGPTTPGRKGESPATEQGGQP